MFPFSLTPAHALPAMNEFWGDGNILTPSRFHWNLGRAISGEAGVGGGPVGGGATLGDPYAGIMLPIGGYGSTRPY